MGGGKIKWVFFLICLFVILVTVVGCDNHNMKFVTSISRDNISLSVVTVRVHELFLIVACLSWLLVCVHGHMIVHVGGNDYGHDCVHGNTTVHDSARWWA